MSPVRSSFEIKGLADYLETLQQGGQSVDQAVADVLATAGPIAEQRLEENLRRTSETWTGSAAETIFSTPVQKDGNFFFVEVGVDASKDPAGVYKELGTARQAAEPFIRPAFRRLRQNEIKTMMKAVLQRLGLRV